MLPEGFEERITKSGEGILVKKWAPQVEILSHGSTGVFMSHCGWNSNLESLSQGMPIIGWPMAAEQFYNTKILEEELGVVVEIIGRGVEEIVRRKVESVVRLVMGGTEKAEEMRRNALRVGETMKAATRGKREASKALVLLQLMILFGQQFQKEEWLNDPLLACLAYVSIEVDLVEPIMS